MNCGRWANFAQIVPGTALANVTSYTDATVAGGADYVYRVIAYNAAGETVSNTVGIFTPSGASVFPASLTFAGRSLNTTSTLQTVTLYNTGGTGLTGISIGLSGANPGDFGQTNACGTTLAAGSKCAISVTFRPTAINTRTASLNISSNDPVNPTLTVSLTGTGSGVPAPTGLTGAISIAPPLNITLNWVNNAPGATFKIQRAANSTFTVGVTNFTVGANVTTYVNFPVIAGVTYYYYRIQAVVGAATSLWANTAAVSTAVPAVPTGLAATAARTGTTTTDQVTLTWNATGTNIGSFTIQRATNSSFSMGGRNPSQPFFSNSTEKCSDSYISEFFVFWFNFN